MHDKTGVLMSSKWPGTSGKCTLCRAHTAHDFVSFNGKG